MSLLNVGARALLANQVALQTTGHNIANVSTPGYSRQSVVMQAVPGQFSGGGYIGKGVDVATILRNHNELLTRQAAAAQAMQAADTTRAERSGQLQNVFQGGASGLGGAISDMLNALGDVVSAPTDISARAVTLTRIDEMAARMRSAAQQLQEIDYSVTEQLQTNVTQVNMLARSIADVNQQIASAKGNGQTPNDLLDKRDQLVRELNQYVQTTQVLADDGTLGIFVASSQALVLGSSASQLSYAESQLFPGSRQMALYFERPGAAPIELEASMLGGGQITGLLRFANQDLTEGRNLLGRMALAIGSMLNYQQGMGLTLDGTPGKALFSTPPDVAGLTSGASQGKIAFASGSFTPTQFAASDYEVRFSDTPPAGMVVRLSDNRTFSFTDLNDLRSQSIDGLCFDFDVGYPPLANERVLFKPFASAAADLQALLHSPRELAAANPVNARMGSANAGSLQLAQLQATGERWDTGAGKVVADATLNLPPAGGVTLTYQSGPPAGFVVTGTTDQPLNLPPPAPYTPGTTAIPYQAGEPIRIDGWSITLHGTPRDGDSVTLGNALDSGDWYQRDAGNASALMGLRDVKTFDDSTLADGYAALMAQVGTRTQSAQYAARLSESIAANLEASRSAISGVNLDEEAAKLIQYQQAYQASAKVLQIAQNIFDNLIASMGR